MYQWYFLWHLHGLGGCMEMIKKVTVICANSYYWKSWSWIVFSMLPMLEYLWFITLAFYYLQNCMWFMWVSWTHFLSVFSSFSWKCIECLLEPRRSSSMAMTKTKTLPIWSLHYVEVEQTLSKYVNKFVSARDKCKEENQEKEGRDLSKWCCFIYRVVTWLRKGHLTWDLKEARRSNVDVWGQNVLVREKRVHKLRDRSVLGV